MTHKENGLSGQALKLVAAAAMLVDHVGFALADNAYYMRLIGRIAFPIFAFMLAEGFLHTKSRGRYCLRLLLFAAVSEPFFDFGLFGRWSPDHQNTLFTLAVGLLGLWGAQRLLRYSPLAAMVPLAGAAFAAELLKTDYGALGVLLTALYWLWRGKRFGVPAAVAAFVVIQLSGNAEAGDLSLNLALMRLGCFLAVPFLMLYSGRRGAGGAWAERFFYLFYPGHLALIWALRSFC